jgi:tRNA modification GTPase
VRDDTIVAVATPPGEGGVGIVRLSGRDARPIASRLFSRRLANRRAVLGHICDPSSGEIVDEALGLLMLAPHTYTREDVVELHAHGGPVCLQQIVELSLREGARLAEPGEFTLRAFLNGRLDLAQAEAVLDVVKARTDASLRLAVQGLGGRLSGAVRSIRGQVLESLAYLSARADFPDEDVPLIDLQPGLLGLENSLTALIATARQGMIYRQGVRIAIVGRPNVGKSSLLNRLLREDRAIVTPIPGTTRDTVSETLDLGGVPAVLTDTAGIEQSDDPVERLGIERSMRAIEQSDLLLLVLEFGRPLLHDEQRLLHQTQHRPRVIALNKCDLGDGPSPADGEDVIRVSALTGEGIGSLERCLRSAVGSGSVASSDATIVTNPRHAAALGRALASLQQARLALAAGLPEDLAGMDLRAAADSLGEITGDTVTEDLLDTIFRNFCIGK